MLLIRLFLAVSFMIFGVALSDASSSDMTRKVWAGKLNINSASSADFMMLPGIGEVTAHRICKFREDKGGFKSVAQLKQVKGISESLFTRLEPNLTLFEKSDLRVLIDINTASMEALKRLPGMSLKEAGSIIDYRIRNKGFKKMEDIYEAGISREQFEEIKDLLTLLPYPPIKEKM